ncbi:MAG: cell wall-binding repeat-containing protein [Finegoldia magna]|nr:cell wall-binding repeat-containing protein [Finegoldia magna]
MKNKKILGLMLAGMIVANIIPQVSSANGAYQISRIFGKSRYNTSAEISRSVGYHSDKVILVSGENFADALTAGNLSDVGPILLTEKGKISQRVLNEMARNGAKQVIIVGGEGSVSKNVEKQLKGKKITRIAGRNRYETSTKLAKQLNTRNKGVVLANGDNFADALAAAPYAVQQSKKLVLTNGKELPKGINKEEVVEIIGGKKSVNIKGLENVNRISGKNRYETAIKVAEKFGKITEIVIADGRNYPDALSSAPLAVKMKTGILLAEDSQVNALKNFLDQTYVTDVAVVGGKNSVSESLIKKLFSNAEVVNISDDTDIEIPEPEEKPAEKPDDKKPEDKPAEKPDDKKPEDKPEEPKQPSELEEKPQDQTVWRQERLKPQSSKDIDLSNFDMDTPLSEKEKELVKLINDYRISLGKKPLNVSKSLTYVARTHTKDQILHFEYDLKDERGLPANLHSWSKYGNWTPVMYTDDHQYGALTRKKPAELTQYKLGGLEISVGQQNYDQVHQITPSVALRLWKNSPGHNHEIIKDNILYDVYHAERIMGISIHDGFANVWFGSDPNDPAGFHITYEK